MLTFTFWNLKGERMATEVNSLWPALLPIAVSPYSSVENLP